jgi:hypothetical protein
LPPGIKRPDIWVSFLMVATWDKLFIELIIIWIGSGLQFPLQIPMSQFRIRQAQVGTWQTGQRLAFPFVSQGSTENGKDGYRRITNDAVEFAYPADNLPP